jgi:hypothetical protein
VLDGVELVFGLFCFGGLAIKAKDVEEPNH